MIRAASVADLPALARLLADVHRHHERAIPRVFKPLSIEEAEAILLADLSGANRYVVVVSETGAVQGYAKWRMERRPETPLTRAASLAIVDELCIDEAARGRALSHELLDAIAHEARALGAERLHIEVWEGNEAAQRSYGKNGFTMFHHRMWRWLS